MRTLKLISKNGSAYANIVEHPQTAKEVYSVEWRKVDLDLSELAKLRWEHNKTIAELAGRFERQPKTIRFHLNRLKAQETIKGKTKP